MTIVAHPITADILKMPDVLPQTRALQAIFADIRDRGAPHALFVRQSRRVMRLLLEAALDHLPYEGRSVTTPSRGTYHGTRQAAGLCGVSVLRAGDSMEAEFRAIAPHAPIGKILIQRDTVTKLPKFYFAKLPPDIAARHVFLLDPMLATGGTAVEALSQLVAHGVAPERIVFVTLLSVSDGLNRVAEAFPDVQVVSASIEHELNEQAFMLPGIGDFGDRYFGTC